MYVLADLHVQRSDPNRVLRRRFELTTVEATKSYHDRPRAVGVLDGEA